MRSSFDRIDIGRQRIQCSQQTSEVVASMIAVTHHKTHTKKKPPGGGSDISLSEVVRGSAATRGHEAKAAEAQDHHGPGGRFGDGGHFGD
jgi:hypothetical protein